MIVRDTVPAQPLRRHQGATGIPKVVAENDTATAVDRHCIAKRRDGEVTDP